MSEVDLFAVLFYPDGAPYYCSIAKLTTQVDSQEWTAEQMKNPRVFHHTKYLAHIKKPNQEEPPRCDWLFCPPSGSSNDFYMLPDQYPSRGPRMHGAKFNCSTNELQSIEPNTPKVGGHVANVGGDIYYKADPNKYHRVPDHRVFERYVPYQNEWKNILETFPNEGFMGLPHRDCRIVATAVWNDAILFNIGFSQFWAFRLSNYKWYHVFIQKDVEGNSRCYGFQGEGIVVDNTIYALTSSFTTVLALSIETKQADDGDLQYRCSFLSEISVPYMAPVRDENAFLQTKHFLHVGGDNFCLVQSCKFYGDLEYQTIHVTGLKLMGKDKMVVTNVCIHRLKILKGRYGQFLIKSCFSRPVCKVTALVPHEKTFIFDPFTGIVKKKKVESYLYPEPEVGKTVEQVENVTLSKGVEDPLFSFSRELRDAFLGITYESGNTDREGRSVIVVNLPHGTTARQVEMGLNKFGHLKRGMIRLKMDTRECFIYAIVEFESATSARLAIEASPVIIGGCPAYILEKLAKS